MCLSNSAAVNMAEMSTANDGICFRFQRTGTDGWDIIYNADDTTSTIIGGAAWQTRYLTVTRSGSTCTLNVRETSHAGAHATGSPENSYLWYNKIQVSVYDNFRRCWCWF